jgi:cysteine desulfuration protein SufE
MSRIDQIIEEFKGLEPAERLELLLEYSDKLPTLPERYQNQEETQSHTVNECQSPVTLWVEVEGGKVAIHAEVPREAPTVRGFLAMLIEAFNGASPRELLEAPTDILIRSGLAEAIGMRRQIGLEAVMRHIKQAVVQQAK